MSMRADVRYMPADTSVFRSRSSFVSFSRSVRRTPIPAAAESRKPRTPPVGSQVGRAGEAVAPDLCQRVGRAEPAW